MPATGVACGAVEDPVRDTFGGAADSAGGLPFIGDDLARALSTGTQAGEGLVAAGDQEIAAIEALASGLSWAVALLAIVPVVVAWVWLRVRWMLSARAVILLRDDLRGGQADADLLEHLQQSEVMRRQPMVGEHARPALAHLGAARSQHETGAALEGHTDVAVGHGETLVHLSGVRFAVGRHADRSRRTASSTEDPLRSQRTRIFASPLANRLER